MALEAGQQGGSNSFSRERERVGARGTDTATPWPVSSLSRERERVGVRVGAKVQSARSLRAHETDAEQTLWRHLRARQFHDYKFRRQHPIGPYIADFACVQERLVVELDGGQHAQADERAHDTRRTQFLHSQGWRVLRFWNHEVLTELAGVLQAIALGVEGYPHPNPLPLAGEGGDRPLRGCTNALDPTPLPLAGEGEDRPLRGYTNAPLPNPLPLAGGGGDRPLRGCTNALDPTPLPLAGGGEPRTPSSAGRNQDTKEPSP